MVIGIILAVFCIVLIGVFRAAAGDPAERRGARGRAWRPGPPVVGQWVRRQQLVGRGRRVVR
ncbi:hypothetical protein SVIOM74S_09051 [Streptomyces violarus]